MSSFYSFIHHCRRDSHNMAARAFRQFQIRFYGNSLSSLALQIEGGEDSMENSARLEALQEWQESNSQREAARGESALPHHKMASASQTSKGPWVDFFSSFFFSEQQCSWSSDPGGIIWVSKLKIKGSLDTAPSARYTQKSPFRSTFNRASKKKTIQNKVTSSRDPFLLLLI